MQTCADVDRAKVAALVALRERLDPFALAAMIDRQLETLYALANHRHRPTLPAASAPDPAAAAPVLAKPSARLKPLLFGKAARNYHRRRLVTS